MIMKVFGVYDLKALAYLQPFFSQSTGAAIRAFEDVVNDGNSPIAKHPGDYQLFELGTFDDTKGLLSGTVPAVLLCGGAECSKGNVGAMPVMSAKEINDLRVSNALLRHGEEIVNGK